MESGKSKKRYELIDAEKIKKIKRSPSFHVPTIVDIDTRADRRQ